MPIPLIERLQRHVPVGVVRRRVRPHRDGLGRHVPRPREHRDEARQRRPAVPVPRARHLGRARRVAARRASAARSCCAARRCSRATGAIPTRRAAAFAGGWFHTGDIGVQDDDGYLYIVDRLKDMIVSGGENIASSEVERVLYEHESVVEAAVVGRPDERWGEVPVAYVVLSAGRDDDARRAHRALPRGSSRSSRSRRRWRSSTRSRGTRRARSSSGSCGPASLSVRCASERGRPGLEVGRDGVAGLVVDRRPVARRRPRSSARPSGGRSPRSRR